MGAIFAPLGALRGAMPILTALGIAMSIESAQDSINNGRYAQAVFRVASAALLPWAVNKLRQLVGPLKLSRGNGGQPQLSGGNGGNGGTGSGGGGTGGGTGGSGGSGGGTGGSGGSGGAGGSGGSGGGGAGSGGTPPGGGGLVIGRGGDLAQPGALGPGEYKLSWPPTSTTRSEWKINSGLLRQEMGRGLPIRDASPGDSGGWYLNAERNLLRTWLAV